MAVLLALLALPQHASSDDARSQDGVSITYLANEGVLISSGTKKVLIDALFQEYRGYATPADSTARALAGAAPPFDSVDLVLVTHRHGDHFHPVPVVAHLRSNPQAVLVTSAQVIDSLRGRLMPDAVPESQLLSRTTAPGDQRREVINGISIYLLGLPHGGERHRAVEHLGFVVELGGRRVLHVGDTDISEHAFEPLRLDTARIDVALLPAWMVMSDEGRRVIERWIQPGRVLAFHVAKGEERKTVLNVRDAMPSAITLTRSLERYRR
jgi:L-ascorbate metabolism protein UlaG (beta-lactamase superfamily)